MSLRTRLARWLAPELKYGTLDLFREIYGGRESASGVSVSWSRALEVSTVLACTRVIAEGVAQSPWGVYRANGGERMRMTDHPVHRLLHTAPNDRDTAFGFKETMLFHTVLTGNAYAFVYRVGSAREPRRLEIIEPQRVTVEKTTTGGLAYRVQADDGGVSEVFPAEAIWHVRGPSWNGWQGMEAVKLAREAIGLAISAESQSASMHKGGARIAGVYSVEEAISPERYAQLSAWLDKHNQGGEREGKPLIIGAGAKWTPQQMTGVDAQHIETRRHQIEEICRAFRVMPLMVGHPADMAARAATESIFLQHVVHTLMPWYARLEQSADMALLSEAERAAGLYTMIDPRALMRGAARDRAEYYTRALGTTQQPGWMTVNEVRALEDMPPVGGGDEFVPLITATQGGDNANADVPA